MARSRNAPRTQEGRGVAGADLRDRACRAADPAAAHHLRWARVRLDARRRGAAARQGAADPARLAVADRRARRARVHPRRLLSDRSEEHTSELQSLLRISYAVFCLKKTTK